MFIAPLKRVAMPSRYEVYHPHVPCALHNVLSIVLLISCRSVVADQITPTCTGESEYLKDTISAVHQSLNNVKAVQLPTAVHQVTAPMVDATLLHGYAFEPEGASASILIAPGNGMAARSVISKIPLNQVHHGIYVFDYRGHGENEGNTTSIAQLEEDTAPLWRWVAAKHPQSRTALYGMSQGGVVALSMLDKIASQDGILVLDGTPSRIPRYGIHFLLINHDWFSCPSSLDPVNRIQAAAQLPRLEIVRGEFDHNVTWHDASELFGEASSRGIPTEILAGMYHPFSPRDDAAARMLRIEKIIDELDK